LSSPSVGVVSFVATGVALVGGGDGREAGRPRTAVGRSGNASAATTGGETAVGGVATTANDGAGACGAGAEDAVAKSGSTARDVSVICAAIPAPAIDPTIPIAKTRLAEETEADALRRHDLGDRASGRGSAKRASDHQCVRNPTQERGEDFVSLCVGRVGRDGAREQRTGEFIA
jgi:hypothetical protein